MVFMQLSQRERAENVLNYYEKHDEGIPKRNTEQVSFDFDEVDSSKEVMEKLDLIDPLKVTPMEAINLLYELKETSKK